MKLSTNQIQALEHIHDEAYHVIRASEAWADSYQQAPDQFKALVKAENSLYRKMKLYFKQLGTQRVADWVNWQQYERETIKAADVTVAIDDSQSQIEQTILLSVMLEDIKDMMAQGVMGAGATYTRWIGTATVNDLVSQQAIDHAGELAKGLTQTTLNDVQRSIQTSIKLGEDLETATKRLQQYISDPNRAELIARTESVRAYNAGIHAYGKQSGAATHTWEALPGADEGSSEQPCVDDNDQGPIDIDEDFISGDPFPPAHPNCRCLEVLQYDTTSSDDTSPLDM